MPGEGEGVRLQKVLAQAGLGSRRACEELIERRRVRVNGEVAVLGRRVDPETDVVEVDGAQIGVRPGLVHYLLHKPAGVITTADDPQGRPTVVDLVPAEPRVFPVGRLDVDTEGLLLLTNDGELAAALTHPRHGVERTYEARVAGMPDERALEKLRKGVPLDGRRTMPAEVRLLNKDPEADGVLLITIREGRNRQVRRMCEAVGHPVDRLKRTRIGPIGDRKLRPGEWRELSPEEVRKLRSIARPKEERDQTPRSP